MGGVVETVKGAVGQDQGSQDRKARQEQELAKQQAAVDAQNASVEEAKKRQLDISNQNKIDALRRRKGGSSMISGDTISNDSPQVTLG